MFDRKTIIAMVLVGVVLLLLPKYYELITPKKQTSETTTPVVTEPEKLVDSSSTSAVTLATSDIAEKVEAAVAQTASSVPVDTLPYEPEYVRVETPMFVLKIGSNAQVSSYEIKDYKSHGGSPVSLHQRGKLAGSTLGYLDFDLGIINYKTIKFNRFTALRPILNLTSGSDSVSFTSVDSAGKVVILTYVFSAEHYGFDITLQTKGLNVPETGEFKAKWIGGVPATEQDATRDVQYAAAYAQVGEELEKFTTGRERQKEFTATGQTPFVAARSKYFIAAIIPDEPAAGVEIHGKNDAPREKASVPHYDLTLRQTWKGNASGRWTVYWGPIKYENLKALNVGLENTMNWGWPIIKPFSIGVLWALTAMHKVITNYGIVIIIFSVVVKLVLWPLTRKSQISMKKMSALQPEIQALRELHSKNSQALNQAIMSLYKERGVNPASGCIPLLLQMPLLYALFIIFSSTIEFRQAPFIFWITDLSLPDYIATLPFALPMYGSHVAILPIIMAVTQFFMSKKTTTDPNQKFLLYVMPVFMLLIFNNLPSGLTFYYTLFNLLAIVEQQLIKLPDFTPSVEVVEEKKKGKK